VRIVPGKSAISALPLAALAFAASAEAPRATMPDTWSAVDGLGRAVAMHGEAPAPRVDRFVGVFYYIWHGSHGYDVASNPTDADQGPLAKTDEQYRSPFVIPDILAQPAAERAWGPVHAFHHWGESRWGFYLADDEWVIRKNTQLLADAGVDVMFIDVTNGFTYRHTYLEICRIHAAMRAEGNRTPAIAFLAWNGDDAAPRVYEDFYAKGLYRDHWFLWKGKPLILCKQSQLTPEMRDFFEVRESWAWTDPNGWFGDGRDKWPWLADTPQKPGWHESPDKPEQIVVATAQHPVTNKGKCFRDGAQPPPAERDLARGPYFAEQWKRALDVDPEFVFVTQWNEWIAQRFVATEPMQFAGETIATGDSFFVDAYTPEYNRDIEPMKGGYSDNYYWQMVDGIRRFKGAAAPPATGEYLDDIGDAFHRSHPGYGSAGPYVDDSGRNDIVSAHVECDAIFVRIRATTREPLSPSTDANWMTLFVCLPRPAPAWESFHLVANRVPPRDGKAVLERSVGGWSWEEAATLDMTVADRTVEIAIPRSLLAPDGAPVVFDFKWADNMQSPGDAIDWMVSGDAAPNARFAYAYRELKL